MQTFVSLRMENSGRYKPGRVASFEEIQKRSEGLKKAWETDPRKHGMYNTKFYNSWRSMITRCRGTAGEDSKKKYRDRGIVVCERWTSFKAFYEDMFPTYEEGLTIDRINDAKIYSKETCKWSTAKEQANNKRNTVRINGYTFEEWADRLGMSYSTLRKRYYYGFKKGKMTIDQVFSNMKFTRKMNLSNSPVTIRDENKLL